MNTKAQTSFSGGMIFLVVFMGLLIFLMLVAFVFSLFGPYLLYATNTAANQLDAMPADQSQFNITGDIQNTVTPVIKSLNVIEWISYIFIIGLVVTILGLCYFVQEHPIIIAPYLLISLVLIVVSLFIQSAYTSSANAITQTWSLNALFMGNLSTIIMAICGFGFIFMVIFAARGTGGIYSG